MGCSMCACYGSPRTCVCVCVCVCSVAMSLECFGFLSRQEFSIAASTSLLAENTSLFGPHIKRRHFISMWKGCEWLHYGASRGVMFCHWCRKHGKRDARNGPNSMDNFNPGPSIINWWQAG